MEFTIGQRVRITAPGSFHGLTGTVYDIQRPVTWFGRLCGETGVQWAKECSEKFGVHPRETGYLVDVDGVGRYAGWYGGLIGFPYYWLRPIEDPKAGEFIAAMEKYSAVTKKRCFPDVSTLSPEEMASVTGGA